MVNVTLRQATREQASGAPVQSVLETYDAASLTLLGSVPNPDTMQYTVELHPTSLAISPSGRWLYMMKIHNTATSTDMYLSAYDTMYNQFVGRVSLPACKSFGLVPAPTDLTVTVACAGSPVLQQITIDESTGSVAAKKSVAVPLTVTSGKESTAVASVFPLPGGNSLGIITNQGAIFSLNQVLTSVAASSAIATAASPANEISVGILSPTQSDIYVPVTLGTTDYASRFNSIANIDALSLTVKGIPAMLSGFFDMTLSRDGTNLYTLSPATSTITVLDARTLAVAKQLNSLVLLGHKC